MYTQDIYYRLFPKLLQYTSAGIPIHHRPMSPSPNDPPDRAFAAFLSRPRRGHRAGDRAVGPAPTALVCSLRQIAKCLDRPAEVIPARWHSVRISVAQLHHARIGVTAKTLANHKANVRA